MRLPSSRPVPSRPLLFSSSSLCSAYLSPLLCSALLSPLSSPLPIHHDDEIDRQILLHELQESSKKESMISRVFCPLRQLTQSQPAPNCANEKFEPSLVETESGPHIDPCMALTSLHKYLSRVFVSMITSRSLRRVRSYSRPSCTIRSKSRKR
jgi:hypothetical protein